MYMRKAEMNDLQNIMRIYDSARKFMIDNGNPSQWADGYPSMELITDDIISGHFYTCIENGRIVGAFAFILGVDPTYQRIEQGRWRSSEPYGTIHRIASDGSVKAVAQRCFDFCREKCNHLRIDTHRDNFPMQAAIRKYGFHECGIIYIENGEERIAFDFFEEAG